MFAAGFIDVVLWFGGARIRKRIIIILRIPAAAAPSVLNCYYPLVSLDLVVSSWCPLKHITHTNINKRGDWHTLFYMMAIMTITLLYYTPKSPRVICSSSSSKSDQSIDRSTFIPSTHSRSPPRSNIKPQRSPLGELLCRACSTGTNKFIISHSPRVQ